jgi:hypothetical protein
MSNEVQEFVVDRDSATLLGYNKLGLDLNHFQLNKYSGPENDYYRRVKDVIVDMINKALTSPSNCKNALRLT